MKFLPFFLLMALASAKPALADPAWSETIIDSPSTRVIQEADTPGGFIYELHGRVKIGDEACAATGRSARLTQRLDDGILVVTAEVSESLGKTCPGTDGDEGEAVYVDVATELRGDSSSIAMIVLRHVDALNNDITIDSLFTTPLAKDDVLVLNGRVTERNAGADPDAFAVSIKLNYELAANPCLADAYQVDLTQEVVEDVLYLKVTKTLKKPQQPVCVQGYKPVTQTMKKTIRGLKTQIRDIQIENVRSFGNSISLAKFL